MSSLVKYLLFATNFLIFVSSTSNGYKLTWNMPSACVTCFPIEVLLDMTNRKTLFCFEGDVYLYSQQRRKNCKQLSGPNNKTNEIC